MLNAVDIKWDMLGANLATLSNNEQADFFKGFAHELASPCFESHFAREVQILSVNDKLSVDTKKVLEEYLPSLWYKEDK